MSLKLKGPRQTQCTNMINKMRANQTGDVDICEPASPDYPPQPHTPWATSPERKVQTSEFVREPRLDGSRASYGCNRGRAGSVPRQIRIQTRWGMRQVGVIIWSRSDTIEPVPYQVREMPLKWSLGRGLPVTRALSHADPGTEETGRG